MKRLILLSFFCICILFHYNSAFAQTTEDKQKSHLIVALDRRAPGVERAWLSDIYVRNTVARLLRRFNVSFDSYSGDIYAIKEGASAPNDFVSGIVPISISDNLDVSLFTKLHDSIHEDGSSFYSITSAVKPFTLVKAFEQTLTNRTFLALITDLHYNGLNDFYGEINFVRPDFSADAKKYFDEVIANVQNNYLCKYLGELNYASNAYVQLYEYIPLQQYFSMESVLDFPHSVIATRRKDGNYDCTIKINSLNNNNYEIKRLVCSLYYECWDDLSTSNEADSKEKEKKEIESISDTHEFSFSIPKNVQGINAKLKSWILLKDGFYNCTVMHPDGSPLQGANGLVRTINIIKEPNATVLGLFELPDWMFKYSLSSTQQEAATMWTWILIVLALLIVIWIIYLNQKAGKIEIESK